MRNLNRVIGVVLLILTGLVLWESSRLPILGSYGPGPSLVPTALGFMLIILAIIMIIEGELFIDKKEPAFDVTKIKKILTIMVIFAAYFYLIVYLGFSLATFIFFITIMSLIEKMSFKFSVPISLGFTVFIYVLFHIWLSVPIPKGIIERLIV